MINNFKKFEFLKAFFEFSNIKINLKIYFYIFISVISSLLDVLIFFYISSFLASLASVGLYVFSTIHVPKSLLISLLISLKLLVDLLIEFKNVGLLIELILLREWKVRSLNFFLFLKCNFE